ncbi:hypothetical protein H4R99_000594 [Coemansia sp. RSA 1722]|nr:hypothetical protein IWW45_000383 [Coemansia sp. RSA 485]KAJ2606199.1 hypothetical protein H4R99_000594 [Coemansia sp. RSA 1722]KAJ2639677.1 hypothetical protein GGF40_000643 [Coemansia sp. RSA 1286]
MVCIICHESVLVPNSSSANSVTSRDDHPAALSCGHTFHKLCIEQWLSISHAAGCPICHKMHTGSVITLYIEVEDAQLPAVTSTVNGTRVCRRRKPRDVEHLIGEFESLVLQSDVELAVAVHEEQIRSLQESLSEAEEKLAAAKERNHAMEDRLIDNEEQLQIEKSVNASLRDEIIRLTGMHKRHVSKIGALQKALHQTKAVH